MNIKESTLSSGLRVITSENPYSPIVTMSLVVKAGSRFESDDENGYAHILEHMLLKGSVKYPTSYDRGLVIDGIGAYANALTGKESCQFILQASAQHKEKLFDVMSQQVLHSLLLPEVLENEKKIILEELRGDEDNPGSMATRKAVEKFFEGHPLSRAVIGTAETIKGATVEKLKEYYSKFYVPNNSALMFFGNISHQEALVLAEKYFGEWKSGELPEIKRITPAPLKENHYFYKMDGQRTQMRLYYQIPKADTVKNEIVMDMIANFLSYGYSSVLTDELRSKQGLIYGLSVSADPLSEAGIFAITTASANPKAVADIIFKTMEGLAKKVDDSVLEKLKSQMIGLLARRFSDPLPESRAFRRAFSLYGKIISEEDLIKTVGEVTLLEIVSAIKKYMIKEGSLLTIAGPADIQ